MKPEKAEQIADLMAEIRTISESINFVRDHDVTIGSYVVNKESATHVKILDAMEEKKRKLGDKLESL